MSAMDTSALTHRINVLNDFRTALVSIFWDIKNQFDHINQRQPLYDVVSVDDNPDVPAFQVSLAGKTFILAFDMVRNIDSTFSNRPFVGVCNVYEVVGLEYQSSMIGELIRFDQDRDVQFKIKGSEYVRVIYDQLAAYMLEYITDQFTAW